MAANRGVFTCNKTLMRAIMDAKMKEISEKMDAPLRFEVTMYRLKKTLFIFAVFVSLCYYFRLSNVEYIDSRHELAIPTDCQNIQLDIVDQITANQNKDHPLQFLRYSRNPCWYEYFNESDVKSIRSNEFIQIRTYTDIKIRMENLASYFENRLKSSSEHSNVRLRCLPSFNIVGQAKCGTTDLYQRISYHPQVLMGVVKEPFWWSHGALIPFQYYVELNDEAAAKIDGQLREAKCKSTAVDKAYVLGEGSVASFSEQLFRDKGDVYGQNRQIDTPSFIKWITPDSKIIVILRNPVARLYSDYIYFGEGPLISQADFHNKTLETIASYKSCSKEHGETFCATSNEIVDQLKVPLYRGLYSIMMKVWMASFSKENLLVLQMEHYSKNMAQTLEKVYRFLDLESPTDEENELILQQEVVNKNDVNIGEMWDSTREILKEFYQPYNRELAKLLKDGRFLWE